MIRWAIVEVKTEEAVQLQVVKSPACDGCQLHCDKPLFDIFKLHEDQFWLKKNNSSINISNPELLFSKAGSRQVGQKIGMELSDDGLLKSAFLLYILPMVLSMITMIIGQMVFVTLGLKADLGSLLGFVLGFFLFFSLMQTKWRFKALPKVTFL